MIRTPFQMPFNSQIVLNIHVSVEIPCGRHVEKTDAHVHTTSISKDIQSLRSKVPSLIICREIIGNHCFK